MTTAASREKYLDTIMFGRCQGDDTFVAFQSMESFRFLTSGECTFSKDIKSPSICCSADPYLVKSAVLR